MFDPLEGTAPDGTIVTRVSQITRLKAENTALRQRLTEHDETIAELAAFKTEALSRLAAQHDEITRLRTAGPAAANVKRLPTPNTQIGPC